MMPLKFSRSTNRLICLQAIMIAISAGCAAVPTHISHPELSHRKGGIRTIGILPPAIGMFEERPRFGMNKMVPHDEWAPAAADAVMKSISAEMAANGYTTVSVTAEDPDLKEMVELYSAVEFSIQRHSWDVPTDTPPREPFPEKVRSLDYSVGPIQAGLDRRQIDAVCIIRGYNLLPTVGAQVKEGLETVIGVLSAIGGGFGPGPTLLKLGLSVAIIDRTGSVIYYGVVNEQTGAGRPTPEGADGTASAKGISDTAWQENLTNLDLDIRDPRVARHYIKAALSGYMAEGAP